jgi:hypothetical protein
MDQYKKQAYTSAESLLLSYPHKVYFKDDGMSGLLKITHMREFIYFKFSVKHSFGLTEKERSQLKSAKLQHISHILLSAVSRKTIVVCGSADLLALSDRVLEVMSKVGVIMTDEAVDIDALL